MLIVMATIRARTGHGDTLADVLGKLAAASRTEAGCSAYRVFRATQDRELFSTFEQWASSAAEAQHMASAHVAAALQSAAALLAAPPEIRHLEEI